MASFHVLTNAETAAEMPQVRQIGFGDLIEALREGWRDFWRKPSHLVFLGLISLIALPKNHAKEQANTTEHV